MDRLSHFHHFVWTVRYLKLGQIWNRGRRNLRRYWWKLKERRAPVPSNWQLDSPCQLFIGLPEIMSKGPWREDVAAARQRAEAVSQRRFSFLNQPIHFQGHPDWHDPNLSRLWRFHLHYFDFLNDLLIWSFAGQSMAGYDIFRNLATSWIDSNLKVEGDSWHPYTLSQRLVNWLEAISAFNSQISADQVFHKLLLTNLYGQAQILSSDLELDVRGNHLLKNLRALIFAGLTFRGSESKGWFQKATNLLQRELAEQILADGGHFERNPGYHLEVLKDCLEIAIWLRRNNNSSHMWLNDALRRMLDFLDAIMPPDGKIPLLKDTSWDSAPEPKDLLAAGALYFDNASYKRSNDLGLYPFMLFGLPGWKNFRTWPVNSTQRNSVPLAPSGYYIMRDDARGDQLILDAGKPCPDYLPAHAHADLLSYELLVDGQRVVVDSGVYEYSAGPWRDYFRSTRAHNTVEVAGENQSDVWSSFRVARRAVPGPVVWQETGDYALLQATHDGYRRLAVSVIHRRTVVWRKNQFWLIVDELSGKGRAMIASYVHLHPDLSIEAVDNSIWRFRGTHSPLLITGFGHQTCSIVRGQMNPLRQGWYSERFGQLRANAVLILHQGMDLPVDFGYVISKQESPKIQAAKTTKGREIVLTYDEHENTLLLPRYGSPHFRFH